MPVAQLRNTVMQLLDPPIGNQRRVSCRPTSSGGVTILRKVVRMQVQVNSDSNIKANTELSKFVEEQVERTLSRFEKHITRVEVHLSDSNSHKPGLQDKRCVFEARPAGRQPITTSSESATVEQAVRGAAEKMKNSLETLYGRLGAKR